MRITREILELQRYKLDGESAPKASDTALYAVAPGFHCMCWHILNSSRISFGIFGSECPSAGVNEQASKSPPGIVIWMAVSTAEPTVCKKIRRKSGLQSHLSLPVTANTLNQTTNLTSAQIRSNWKKMSRPQCNRHLSGKCANRCIYERDQCGAPAADKPLSGLRIGGGEMDSHLQVGC